MCNVGGTSGPKLEMENVCARGRHLGGGGGQSRVDLLGQETRFF
jgi:hypothetical protein